MSDQKGYNILRLSFLVIFQTGEIFLLGGALSFRLNCNLFCDGVTISAPRTCTVLKDTLGFHFL